jgi:pimeloyl-ACP methyl ester carboxylesterase
MNDDLNVWYEHILAQMAAESYLDAENDPDFDFKVKDELLIRLRSGANYYTIMDRLEEDGPLSATRMTNLMFEDFWETWEVIDHVPNDQSGFSATLLKNKETGKYTLSFRSTESKEAQNGGDVRRDGAAGANGQISDYGFAWGQLRSMESYFEDLLAGNLRTGFAEDGQAVAEYLASGQLTVTGYSMGSHLAQLFTLMHDDKVEHTYTFNGAGFGEIAGLSTAEEYGQALRDRVSLIDDIMADPFAYLDEVTQPEFDETGYSARGASFTPKEDALNRLLADRDAYFEANGVSGYENLYQDPLFQYAVRALPDDTTGALSVTIHELLPDWTESTREQRTDHDKITNLYGHGTPGEDWLAGLSGEIVAGSGQIFGDYYNVFIEDQPVVDAGFLDEARSSTSPTTPSATRPWASSTPCACGWTDRSCRWGTGS